MQTYAQLRYTGRSLGLVQALRAGFRLDGSMAKPLNSALNWRVWAAVGIVGWAAALQVPRIVVAAA